MYSFRQSLWLVAFFAIWGLGSYFSFQSLNGIALFRDGAGAVEPSVLAIGIERGLCLLLLVLLPVAMLGWMLFFVMPSLQRHRQLLKASEESCKKLEQSLSQERCFSADAAHELRTPLSGILMQVQVAQRVHDDETRRQALARVEQAIEKMAFTLQQLLALARSDVMPEALAKVPVALFSEVRRAVADLKQEAEKKSIIVECSLRSSETTVAGNVALLNSLVRNLIENAIKYTPVGGRIKISLSAYEARRTELCVEDSGPGIPESAYERSLKRFERLPRTEGATQGSGLGFSIVQRVAAWHRADLRLAHSALGGLKVSVVFETLADSGPR